VLAKKNIQFLVQLSDIDKTLLPHLSPLGWERINLNGDYLWQHNNLVGPSSVRPLRRTDRP
jgi:hypothetical protein